MKKLLLPLLYILFFTACEKQNTNETLQKEVPSDVNRTRPKITIWHYAASTGKWKQISICETAWSAHQAHGDIRQIGDDYKGGKICYILQPGDVGYNANVPHGLIAAPFDQSTGAPWGCVGTDLPGADGTAIGTGNSNTIEIMSGCADLGIAAKICGDLNLNGYSDWYLPSIGELEKLYINRLTIGGFSENNYWSSSENGSGYAFYRFFLSGLNGQGSTAKFATQYVRAVRAF